MSPTPRLVVVWVAAALLAGVVSPWAGLALWIVSAGLAVVDARSVAGAPDATWVLPTTLARGRPQPAGVTLGPDLRSLGRRVLVRQPCPAELGFEPAEARGELSSRVTGRRRGRVLVPAPVLRIDGRLGLGRASHRLGEPRPVLIVADLPAARRLAQDVRRAQARGATRAGRRILGLGTEFELVRDYLPDDDIRQVNWSATARTGRPMSNQYRIDQDREVVCLVDAGRLMAAPVGDRTRLDVAVDTAGAVAAVAEQVGDRCGVVVFDDAVRLQLAPKRGSASRVMAAVAEVQPRLVDSRYERAFQALSGQKRALVLVLTDLLDGAAARSLVAALPILSRRHAVVLASCSDPDLEQRLSTEPEDLTDAYAIGVAAGLVAELRQVRGRVEAAGGRVVSRLPSALPGAVVDSYLGLASRLRL